MRAERFFLIVATAAGFVILIITPPFQAPDEINHFYRAYQVSEGQMVALRQGHRAGGIIPDSLKLLAEPFKRLRWDMTSKTTPETILQQVRIPLHSEGATFQDFPNTAVYPATCYFPQAAPILVLRKFHAAPLAMLYGARFFSLAFWVTITFISIRQLPAYKWLFTLLALLPMSLFINVSVSADVVTNGVAFFVITYVLKCAWSENLLSDGNVAALVASAFVLGTAKLFYSPIMLLIFLIPVSKWRSREAFLTGVGLILGITLVTVAICAMVGEKFYMPYSEYDPLYRNGLDFIKDANAHLQLQNMVHLRHVFQVLCNSLSKGSEMYVPGYIGTLGWLDTFFSGWFIAAAYLLIVFVAVMDSDGQIRFSGTHRLVLLASFALVMLLILFSQHLIWEPVGANRAVNVQGRYLIPIAPILFLFVSSFFSQTTKATAAIVMMFALFSCCLTAETLYQRYYVDAASGLPAARKQLEPDRKVI